MSKKRVKWPPDLWYNLTHFKVYRKEFRGSLWCELGEAKILSRTIFTPVAIIVAVVMFWAALGCLEEKNYLLTALSAVIVLADIGFLLFLYRPNCGPSFKECVAASDEEAYKAQLKEERDNPDIYG